MALKDNLISYWKLEESSGTRADAHGSNNLTDNFTVTSGAGKIGTAADFELSNTESLSVGDNPGLSMTGDFTIALWVNIENEPASDNAYALLSKLGSDDGYALEYHESLGFRTRINLISQDFAHNLTPGTFTHVVYRFTSSSKEHSLWIDGSEETPKTGSVNPNDGSESLYLGRSAEGATTFLDGKLDEVSLWSRAITDSEIAEIYNSGSGLGYDSWDVVSHVRAPAMGNFSGGLAIV